MLKVLYIAPLSIKRDHGSGGVETATDNLLSAFSNIHDLNIIFLSFRKERFKTTKLQYSKNISIIQVGRKNKLSLLDILLSQRKIIKELIQEEQPDVIHFHGTGPSILSISNLSKDNIIITQHGINRIELKYQSTLKNKFKYLFKSLIENINFGIFKNYIFVSNKNLELTKEYFNSEPNNYAIIPNAVNNVFFTVKPQIKSTNRILYVGYISRLKNLLLLIRVINKLKLQQKDFYLKIVGSIKDRNYYDECVRYIQNNGLSEYISFLGYIDQKSLINIYNDIDIFVLPSLQENNPISILEAMASGKIAVASNVGGISENIDDTKTGFLFEKDNEDELLQILSRLHNNDALIQQIGVEAKKYALQNKSPQYITKKLRDFYYSIYDNK